jgi:predicted nucleic acid-binding protein
MRELLLDTSVLLKWFHRDGEDELEQAEWRLQAHREGLVHAHVLDLGIYELANVTVRALNRDAQQSRAVLEATLALCGPPLTLPDSAFGVAADIANADGLTFYDASFAAAAREHGCTLASADRELLAAGHAITLTQSVERLRDGQKG